MNRKTEKEIGASAKVKIVKGGIAGSKETIKEYQEVPSNEEFFEEFQKRLDKIKKDGYFIDFDDYDDFDNFEEIKKDSIIKFDAELKIPEKFGQVDLINGLLKTPARKQALISSFDISSDSDKVASEFLKGIIRDDGKVPVYFDFKDYILFSKVKGEYFKGIDFSEFEESVDEEVTVVAKVEKIDKYSKNIVLYDIYKDLLHLNREMRRSFSNSVNSEQVPEELTIKGKGIRLEILAIYK
uniref:DUF6414 family protein n=1 Tax=Clostridium paraputrificum TaxID=29363 RepID=UPI003BAAF8FA